VVDPDLITRIARKEESAFAELFDATRERIWSYLTHMAGRDQAEDLMQEVFVKVWRFAGTMKNPDDATAWMFSIARNTAKSHFRKRSSRPMASLNRERENGDGALVDVITATGDGPAETAESSETAGRVRAALEELPIEQREVIVMKEFQGLKFDEIARILDCPLGTVKSRMRYGTIKLAALLQEVR